LLTHSQEEEHKRSGDDDDDNNEDENDDDNGESPELQAAIATMTWLEAMMVHRIFKLEAIILREEIRVETTWPVRADDEEDDQPEEEEEYWEEQYWEQAEEEYSEGQDDYEFNEGDDEEQDDYESDERDDEEVEKLAGWGRGKRKRTRAQCEEDEDEDVEEEQTMAPSPPTKRAKFEYPCVVPSCDRGYQNKASLQRHVYNDHVVVSDPVVKSACRLLWGETFKGDRLGEVNRRYGEYPKGV
jgi:hypothetical protein